MNKLIAGYFIGEFGWELMRWQAIIRHIAKNYDKVIIGCERDKAFLYEDFATDFKYFDDLGINIESRNMWMANHTVYEMEHEEKDAFIAPIREICLDNGNYHQNFIKWGKKDKNLYYDLLLHARSTKNFNTAYRNWAPVCWDRIVDEYRRMRIASVGSLDGADYIKGTDDLRGTPLKALADTMASSNMIIGPSSGTMHFASLCGLKHIVWSDLKDRGLYNNRDRFDFMWNPFATEFNFIPSWQPEPETVIKECNKWLTQSV